jgi:hypothetical protein
LSMWSATSSGSRWRGSSVAHTQRHATVPNVSVLHGVSHMLVLSFKTSWGMVIRVTRRPLEATGMWSSAGAARGAGPTRVGSRGYERWVKQDWVRKTICFWQKHSPNCDFWVLHRDRLTSDRSLGWLLATGPLPLPNIPLVFLLISFHF